MRRRGVLEQKIGGQSLAYDFTSDHGGWLFVPEIPMDAIVSGISPVHLGRAYGLRTAAIVHDLIPIKLSRDYDAQTVQLYERYYRMFADVDLAVATTDYVSSDLRGYLRARGVRVPNIVVHPLPAQFGDTERRHGKMLSTGLRHSLKLLTVSTWEPRKNLPRLLRAVSRAQVRATQPIELTIVGRRGGFPAYDAEVDALLANLPNVMTVESVSDESLADLYESHHASVYPSFEEGFGLPILESLWLTTPCLCHNASSMAEIAPSGGTMVIDMKNENAICDAILQIVQDVELIPRLTAEIATRHLTSWLDYGAAISASLCDRPSTITNAS
jgi:glycosyltransferase involved in cell wall biosynthesis